MAWERRNEMKLEKRLGISILVVLLVAAGMLLMPASSMAAAADSKDAQAIVDKARVTFNDFMSDQHYTWFHENLSKARGLLIFPQVLKAGFFIGGSGGTGVLVLRDEKTCDWSQPAFYTIGSATFGLQIGAESAEVIMMVMSQKAVDSLLASSFKLGGDASVALGPIGEGAKSNITSDFISFAKAKGLYVGLNLEGSVVDVRDSLNGAYYKRDVGPSDIIVKNDVRNAGSQDLLTTLRKLSTECSS